jgi:hypothetical protein
MVSICACSGNIGGGAGGADAPTGGGGGDGPQAGGGLFTKPMPWTEDVFDAPAAAESQTVITGLIHAGGWGTDTGDGKGPFQMDISIPIQYADGATPLVTFVPKDNAWSQAQFGDTDHAEFYSPDCDKVKMPLPAGGSVEANPGYACTDDGDCHLLVVDRADHHLYEMWRADQQSGTLYGGCLAVWNLDGAYGDTLRGKGCSSADAGGFPIAAMLATPEEVKAGEIKHALRFILPNARIRKGMYVTPGTHTTQPTDGGLDTPPYGVRFRLRKDYPLASLPSDGARVLAKALQHYGMYLADGGSIPITIATDKFSAVTWDSLGVDSHSLNALTPGDFEVVKYSTPIDGSHLDCVRNNL